MRATTTTTARAKQMTIGMLEKQKHHVQTTGRLWQWLRMARVIRERKPVAIMRRLTRLGLHSPRSGGDDGKAAKARLSWHTNRPNPASLRRKATNLCLESNQQRSGMAQHRGLTHFGVSPFERNNRTQQCAWADRDTIERRCKRICRTKSVCWGSALRKVF